ncbi:MAG: Mur ligase domain-containing protein [Bacteroidia bacterium]|nr:Mur ligase domain-containing protein [Bacteroidia bacterium]MDW8089353.1 Mur ligase domain-containing protein [Bacteroidia bacterium]
MPRVHIIGIGGAIMHSLALHLKQQGYEVTGSDDRLAEPARSRLAAAGLLPPQEGWFPEKITPELGLVVVGMHARRDNPELQRAQQLRLPIQDMPTFVARATHHKHRIIVAGSHGKTTTTALLLYAFERLGMPTDWLIGAQTTHDTRLLRLSAAPTFIAEGDEYPASPLNLQPKAAVYRPHWLILTGIAWDHVNVYPTPEDYQRAFQYILQQLPKAGVCFYNETDPTVRRLVEAELKPGWHRLIPYRPLPAFRRQATWFVRVGRRVAPVRFWGRHNILNASAVWSLLQEMYVEDREFAEILSSFRLPAYRQEVWLEGPPSWIVRDFAHAPSKVEATLKALRETFPTLPVRVILELHTYSSLQPTYAAAYKKPLRLAKERWIYLDERNVQAKGADPTALQQALGKEIGWIYSKTALIETIHSTLSQGPQVLALLSSGTFSDLEPAELGLALKSSE